MILKTDFDDFDILWENFDFFFGKQQQKRVFLNITFLTYAKSIPYFYFHFCKQMNFVKCVECIQNISFYVYFKKKLIFWVKRNQKHLAATTL